VGIAINKSINPFQVGRGFPLPWLVYAIKPRVTKAAFKATKSVAIVVAVVVPAVVVKVTVGWTIGVANP
jgi:hypothetical protein